MLHNYKLFDAVDPRDCPSVLRSIIRAICSPTTRTGIGSPIASDVAQFPREVQSTCDEPLYLVRVVLKRTREAPEGFGQRDDGGGRFFEAGGGADDENGSVVIDTEELLITGSSE